MARKSRAAGGGGEPYLIMEGDWGGVVYLTCPSRLIRCSGESLRRVHAELEQLSGDEPKGRGVRVDDHTGGDEIAGRAKFREGIWLDRCLADLVGLEDNVKAILLDGADHRTVFQPSEGNLLSSLSSGREDGFRRAALSILVLAGFHGHLSTPEDRSFWRTDVYALRAGWEVGKSNDDNLEIFMNCAGRIEQVPDKVSSTLRAVEEQKRSAFAGPGGSARFVLSAGCPRSTLGHEAVEASRAAGVTLLPREVLCDLAKRFLGQRPSAEEFFLWLKPGIPR